MTKPTATVRNLTYARDLDLCVSCGAESPLSWQHRESSGSGGRGVKAPVLTAADGVTACVFCNVRFEADLQSLALAMGWKLRRNRGGMLACQIPFFDRNVHAWFLPNTTGQRTLVSAVEAAELLTAAGSIGLAVG
jgi:hypothetical protein